MIEPKIVETDLEFTNLSKRYETDLIVIHHTGNPYDDDLSAEEIHESHQALGWAGIGYHYVIRKDGTIEAGRPEWAIGSHAYGENSHSIGIHLCGNFEEAEPTEAQIESCAYLVGYLCDKYGMVCDSDHVKGHRDLMPTACPGQNLYDILQTIRGKANWYINNYQGGD
jgi:N-acetyl-anhydromuramyl-L-alanine amidase AmpD